MSFENDAINILKRKYPKIPQTTLEVLLRSNENQLDQANEFICSLLQYSSRISKVLESEKIAIPHEGISTGRDSTSNPVVAQFRRKLKRLLEEGKCYLDDFELNRSLQYFTECEEYYNQTIERFEDAERFFFRNMEQKTFEMELYTGFVFLYKLVQPVQPKMILKYLLKIERLFQDQRQFTSERCEICNSIGYYFKHFQKYNQSLKYYHRSLKISKDIDYKRGQSKTLNNLGTIYYELKKYAESLKFLQKSYELRVDIDDRVGQGITLFNISSIYHFGLKDYSKAILFYQKAEKVFLKLNQQHQLLITVKNKIKCIEEIILHETEKEKSLLTSPSSGPSSVASSDVLESPAKPWSIAENDKLGIDEESESQLYEILLDELRKNFFYQRNIVMEMKKTVNMEQNRDNLEFYNTQIEKLNTELSLVLRNLRDVSSSNRLHSINMLKVDTSSDSSEEDEGEEEEEEKEKEEEEEVEVVKKKKKKKKKNPSKMNRMESQRKSMIIFENMIDQFSKQNFPLQAFQLIEFLRKENKTFEIFYPVGIQFLYFYYHRISKTVFVFYFNQIKKQNHELPNLVFFKRINVVDQTLLSSPSHPRSIMFQRSLLPEEMTRLIDTKSRLFVFVDKAMWKINFGGILYNPLSSSEAVHLIEKMCIRTPMYGSLYFLKLLAQKTRLFGRFNDFDDGILRDGRKPSEIGKDFILYCSSKTKEECDSRIQEIITTTRRHSVYFFQFMNEARMASKFLNFIIETYGSSKRNTTILDEHLLGLVDFSSFFKTYQHSFFGQMKFTKLLVLQISSDRLYRSLFQEQSSGMLRKLSEIGVTNLLIIKIADSGSRHGIKDGISPKMKDKFLYRFLYYFEHMNSRDTALPEYIDAIDCFRRSVIDIGSEIKNPNLRSEFVRSVYLFG